MYQTKYAIDSSIDKYKAHLVAKGFSHVEGIDYFETFAPMAKMDFVCLVLALAIAQGCSMFQMDVKSAFHNGYIKEEVYVEQPPGFEDHKHP